jgi:hypothetical protein
MPNINLPHLPNIDLSRAATSALRSAEAWEQLRRRLPDPASYILFRLALESDLETTDRWGEQDVAYLTPRRNPRPIYRIRRLDSGVFEGAIKLLDEQPLPVAVSDSRLEVRLVCDLLHALDPNWARLDLNPADLALIERTTADGTVEEGLLRAVGIGDGFRLRRVGDRFAVRYEPSDFGLRGAAGEIDLGSWGSAASAVIVAKAYRHHLNREEDVCRTYALRLEGIVPRA